MAAREACVHNELRGHRNDQVLDAARLKQGHGANEAGFVGHCTKKLLEVRATPSSVPARNAARVQKSGATPSDSATEAFRYALTG
jgi:hypothetical protein